MKHRNRKNEGSGAFVFALLAIFGVAVLIMMGPGWWAHTRTRSWPAATATILSSERSSNRGKQSIQVQYRYEVGGQTHIGTRFALHGNRLDGEAHARQVQNRFRPGNVVPCYTSPSDPATSILETSSIIEPLALVVALAVAGLGIAGFLFALRADLKGNHAAVAKSDRIAFLIFPLSFIITGAVGVVMLAVIPFLRTMSSDAWREVPCTIVTSEVSVHSGGKGRPTYRYRLELAYEYLFNGNVHVGTHYDFRGQNSGGFDSISTLAAKHPVESKTICFVNPNDPTEAVLIRKSGISPIVLVPVVFMAFGIVIILTTGKRKQRKRSKSSRDRKAPPSHDTSVSQSLK